MKKREEQKSAIEEMRASLTNQEVAEAIHNRAATSDQGVYAADQEEPPRYVRPVRATVVSATLCASYPGELFGTAAALCNEVGAIFSHGSVWLDDDGWWLKFFAHPTPQ